MRSSGLRRKEQTAKFVLEEKVDGVPREMFGTKIKTWDVGDAIYLGDDLIEK